MLTKRDPDFLFNIILAGNSAVGKSCLLNAATGEPFDTTFIPTVGVDFRVFTYEIDQKIVRLHVWDTAGQEKYKSIGQSYYRGAHGGLFVYDVTDRSSFEEVENWVDDAREIMSNSENYVLIGNKCDLVQERKVEFEEGELLAKMFDMKFRETSAKSRYHVKDVFWDLAKQIKDQQDLKQSIKKQKKIIENTPHENQERIGICPQKSCNIF